MAAGRASDPVPFPPEAPALLTPKIETVKHEVDNAVNTEEDTAGYVRNVRATIRKEIKKLQDEHRNMAMENRLSKFLWLNEQFAYLKLIDEYCSVDKEKRANLQSEAQARMIRHFQAGQAPMSYETLENKLRDGAIFGADDFFPTAVDPALNNEN